MVKPNFTPIVYIQNAQNEMGGMPCMQCARSAKFWMSAYTRTLVSAPFHKFLVLYQGFFRFLSIWDVAYLFDRTGQSAGPHVLVGLHSSPRQEIYQGDSRQIPIPGLGWYIQTTAGAHPPLTSTQGITPVAHAFPPGTKGAKNDRFVPLAYAP